MAAKGHDRINVQNNPVNWIDPEGLDKGMPPRIHYTRDRLLTGGGAGSSMVMPRWRIKLRNFFKFKGRKSSCPTNSIPEIKNPPRSVGAEANVKTLQRGGHTLTKRTLKNLGLTKEQGKKAIEALKQDNLLPPNFHDTKILSNGDVVNSNTGAYIGNLHDYLP